MATKRDDRKQVAVVVYPGLTMLELIGTISALDGLGTKTGFRTVTVGESRQPLESDTPMQFIPQSTYDETPHPYAVLVPGSGGLRAITAMGDEKLLAYVRAAAEDAELVASVGSGALILAAAGLLAGRRATTHWAYRRVLENLGATYVQRRWIEDDRFITAGGASGGIDMALHLVANDTGRRSARQVQLWIEYDPQPPFGAIDWRRVDADNALASILAGRHAEVERALAHRPDLLEAVEKALSPAPPNGIRL